MKARFDEQQPSVTTKKIDGYIFIYICLNETRVEEEFEGVKQTYYEYDYHEIKEDEGVLDVDAINANPSLYMNYPDIIQIQEKQLKKKIEKEQREKTLNELPKEEALNYKFLYKEWNSYQDGFELTEGMRLMYKGNLWQVEKTHNKQSDWWPGKDPTLFEQFDKDEHKGTKEDPIPVPESVTTSGFTYIYGKYYKWKDITYLCQRGGVSNPESMYGQEVKLNYSPDALIGHYFIIG